MIQCCYIDWLSSSVSLPILLLILGISRYRIPGHVLHQTLQPTHALIHQGVMVGEKRMKPGIHIDVVASKPNAALPRRIRNNVIDDACRRAEFSPEAAALRLADVAGRDPALLCELANVCQTGPVGRVGKRDCSRQLALHLLDIALEVDPKFTRAMWMRGEALLTPHYGGRAKPPQSAQGLENAEKLFSRAADMGDPEAVFLQGRLLVTTTPEHRCQERAKHGFDLIRWAARHGVARAYISEALCYEKPDEYAPARFPRHSDREILQLYESAAKLGNSLALNDMGNSVATGFAGIKRVFETAERYYRLSIESGAVVAYENIGTLYENGMDGRAKKRIDLRRAHEFYEDGAHLRSSRCCLFMASAYDEGIDGVVEHNAKLAEYFYMLALLIADDEHEEETANFALKDLCAMHVTRIKTNDAGSPLAVTSMGMLRGFLGKKSVAATLKHVDKAISKAKRGDGKPLTDLLGDFNAKKVLNYRSRLKKSRG